MLIIPSVSIEQGLYLENQRQGRTYTVPNLRQNRVIATLFEQARPYPMPGDAQRAQAESAIIRKLAGLAEGLANGNSSAEQMAADLAEQARALVQGAGQ